MARDSSRRPTKRQKTPVQPGAPRAAKAPSAPRPAPARAAVPKRPQAPSRLAAKPAARPRAVDGAPAPRAAASAARGGARRVVEAARGLAGRGGAATSSRERRERYQRGQALRVAGIAAAGVLGVLLVAALALFALRDSSVFSIDAVEVAPTEHVSEADIQNLVKVPAGSTLLNVDTASITEELKKDPWIASVSFERVFPHTLRITIQEQEVDALVVMSSGSIAWYLGSAGTWIQPTSVSSSDSQSIEDVALERAISEGCLLITDVPATVSPKAGSVATDESLLAVEKFREGFSDDFASQVVSYSAPSEDNISCTLSSGVEVLLGSPTDIETKQAFIERIVEANPGTLLFINVRVPSEKGVSFRTVESDNVQGGSGVVLTEQGSGEDAQAQGSEGEQDQGQGGSDGQGGKSGDGSDAAAGAGGDSSDAGETLDQTEGQ